MILLVSISTGSEVMSVAFRRRFSRRRRPVRRRRSFKKRRMGPLRIGFRM